MPDLYPNQLDTCNVPLLSRLQKRSKRRILRITLGVSNYSTIMLNPFLRNFFSTDTAKAWRLLATLPFILLSGFGCAALIALGQQNFFKLVQVGYPFFTIVYPSILLSVGTLILLLSVWNPLSRGIRFAAGGIIVLGFCCIGIRIYATYIEPFQLEVVEHTIVSPKIHSPLKIVHLTDIQSSKVGLYEKKVFVTIQTFHPDLILNTGDNLQPIHPSNLLSEEPKLDHLFKTLKPSLGKYAVQGNVCDRWLYSKFPTFGEQELLQNRSFRIDQGETRLNILGLSLDRSVNPGTTIKEWIKSVSQEEFTIVMGHVPNYMLEAKEYTIDLCLAGHVHGGQIVLPGFGPLVTFCSLPRNLVRGFHPYGKTYINISKGVGAEHTLDIPSIRIFCPPDITVFKLVPETETPIVMNDDNNSRLMQKESAISLSEKTVK